jgi:hypothetical protein
MLMTMPLSKKFQEIPCAAALAVVSALSAWAMPE